MSEKPQAAQAGEQQDLIEQIIAQGLEKLNSPAQAAAAAEAPPEAEPEQADAAEAEPPASKKARRSSVYLYLLILFGAAFLMLLLAYFIQQRGSANTNSDTNSLDLSREALMIQIKDLEEVNAALNVDLSILQRRYDSQVQTANAMINALLEEKQSELYGWGYIWTLEQYYLMGDYVTCARLLLLRAASKEPYPIPDAALWRYDEIVPAVINAGILKEDYYYHPEDYSELLEGDLSFDFDFKYSDVSRETSSTQAP